MQALVKWIVAALLEWVASKVVALISLLKAKKKAHDESVSEANQATDKLQKVGPDSTKDEVDDAIDDASKKI